MSNAKNEIACCLPDSSGMLRTAYVSKGRMQGNMGELNLVHS